MIPGKLSHIVDPIPRILHKNLPLKNHPRSEIPSEPRGALWVLLDIDTQTHSIRLSTTGPSGEPRECVESGPALASRTAHEKSPIRTIDRTYEYEFVFEQPHSSSRCFV